MNRVASRSRQLQVLVLLAVVVAHLAAPARSQAELVRREVFLMGTTVSLEIDIPDRMTGIARLEAMIDILEATEQQLSTWRESSDLSRLNREAVGQRIALDKPLCRLLTELDRWFRLTEGAFDPAVGALIDVWGLRDLPRAPGEAALEAARARSGFDQLRIDEATCESTRLGDVQIDAGAFGKGEALDRILAASDRTSEPWMVDLGGQIMVYAPHDHQVTWTVDLAHPRHRDRTVVGVVLSGGSIATSGGSERDADAPDGPIGHILDPRTGRPVSRSFSVAVWHSEALVADVLSTALYVMGVDEGLRWADAEGFAACFLVPDGPGVELRATVEFRKKFLD